MNGLAMNALIDGTSGGGVVYTISPVGCLVRYPSRIAERARTAPPSARSTSGRSVNGSPASSRSATEPSSTAASTRTPPHCGSTMGLAMRSVRTSA